MKIKNFIPIFMFGALSNVYAQYDNGVFIFLGSPQTPLLTGWNTGVGYERVLHKNLSALFTADFSSLSRPLADSWYAEDRALGIDILAHLRYYPLSTAFNTLFLSLGAGYTFLSLSTDETITNHLFKLQTVLGWKFIIYRMFLEPWGGYNISIGKINYPNDMLDSHEYGFINFGLSIGFIF